MPLDEEYSLRGVTVDGEDRDVGRQYEAIVDEDGPVYAEATAAFQDALAGNAESPELIRPYQPEEDDGIHDPAAVQGSTTGAIADGYGVDIPVPHRVDAARFQEIVEETWEHTHGLGARSRAADLAWAAREGMWDDAVFGALKAPTIVGSAALHTTISRWKVPRYRCGYHVSDHEVHVHLYRGEDHNTINIQGDPYNSHRGFVVGYMQLHDGYVDTAVEELVETLDNTGIGAPEGF